MKMQSQLEVSDMDKKVKSIVLTQR